MSKLYDLIDKLCPNGITYSKVGDVCDIFTGGEAPEDCVKGGEPEGNRIFPVYSNGLKENALYGYSSTYVIDKRAVTFSSIGTIGHPEIREAKFTPIIRLKAIIPKDENVLNLSFLKYALEIVEFKQQVSSVPNVNSKMIANLIIPLPPLEIQLEIVHILDSFSELILKLTEELSNRKKQFEYYYEKMLFENEKVHEFKLGDLFEVFTDFVAAGSFADAAKNVHYLAEPSFAQLVRTVDIKSGFLKGTPVYVDENAFKFLWRVNFDEDCIILPNIGANCGEVYFVKPSDLPYKNNVLGPNAIMLKKCNQNIKYLFFYFKTNLFQTELRKIISPGGQTKFNKTELKKIKIYLPSLERQNQVVSALNVFEELSFSISNGLPAEIELRQNQYEYYRDKLLSFKGLKD